MRIVVTGGSGNVGRYVVDELRKFGHRVTVFDKKEPKDKDVTFAKGNILEVNDCRKAFSGAQAIIHLAAIVSPLSESPERTMNMNVMGTFNVHQAAADLGIQKVVHASSGASYGFDYAKKDLLPYYLPLDEDHPQEPEDCYGLSKKIGEEIASSFTKKYKMITIALRICFVWFPEKVDYYRSLVKEPERWKHLLWIYNDVRDVAFVFRLAVEAKGLKHEVFLISAEDNGTECNSVELVARFYSNRIPFKKHVEGRQSLADWSKAERLLGYKPRYCWRDIIAI